MIQLYLKCGKRLNAINVQHKLIFYWETPLVQLFLKCGKRSNKINTLLGQSLGLIIS